MFQLEKSQDLDLNNPIFVFYINVEGRSRRFSVEYIEDTKKHFDVYKNATMWFVASNKDEVVCIYEGRGRVRDSDLKDLIEEINNKIEIMANSHTFDDFKINVRDWRLAKIVDEK